MDKLRNYLRYAPEVQRALEYGRPVVTFELTDLARHLPYPMNVRAIGRVAATLRENDAVPAPIAVMGGHLCIGLSDGEVDHLGRQGAALRRGSRRDLSILAARGQDAATWVAASMVLSILAGARVFLTASIGGAHRGSPLDISADIEELGRTSLLVVCSGVNPILDAGATLDCLATKGVPVLGYGTDELPALFVRSSGHAVGARVDTPEEAARIFDIGDSIGLRSGVLVTNPIPAQHALDEILIAQTLDDTCTEAAEKGIAGRRLTKLLHQRLQEATGGAAPEALAALMEENARLAARIACEASLL